MVELTHKQYLISNRRIAPQGMEEFVLAAERYLYVGSGLRVRKGETKRGESYVLLGEAYCTDRYPKEVVEDLESPDFQDCISATRYWTGRWVLIVDSILITDACGLMSAFYQNDGTDWMVSSSLALISNQLGLRCDKKVSKTGLTWCLLPYTLQDSVKLLFCTQKMHLGSSLSTEFCNRYEDEKDLSFEERIDKITQCLTIGIKNIAHFSGRKIWLALTAGKDSRLTFAAALSSGVHFDTYTAEHQHMRVADRKMPAKISKVYGIQHHNLRKGKYSTSRYNDYCHFSGFNSLGADAEFYATNQFAEIPDNAVVIRSGIFEAGQTYARRIAGGDRETFIQGIRTYYKDDFQNPVQDAAFNEWLDYQDKHPMFGIDIRDRFYLEQRVNGWVAAIEQSLDINAFVSIQIANSSVILGSMLYATQDDRKNLRLPVELIRQLNEKLLDFPINKSSWRDTVRIAFYGILKRLHV